MHCIMYCTLFYCSWGVIGTPPKIWAEFASYIVLELKSKGDKKPKQISITDMDISGRKKDDPLSNYILVLCSADNLKIFQQLVSGHRDN